MSRANLKDSLDAVEQALEHFAGSLERGGFQAGVPAYRQMATLMIGQRLWASEHGLTELDERYGRLAELALEIHAQLTPYVEVMEQLAALAEITRPEQNISPLGRRILRRLEQSAEPLAAAAVRSAVGGSTTLVARELATLVDRGLVERRVERRRVRFAAIDDSSAKLPVQDAVVAEG